MKQVYLDNQSNTRLDERVFEAMKPYFLDLYGNPQSLYSLGSTSKEALEKARQDVANLINAESQEIIFTSCGTESNNLALKGVAAVVKGSAAVVKGAVAAINNASAASKGASNHIIVSQIEHFSVLNPVKKLQKDGFEVSYIPVDKEGRVKIDEFKKALKPETILVSIQYVNTEIGTIQDIKKLAEIAKSFNPKIIFHTDAVLACGFMPVDVKNLGIDLLTFSSSAMYGPKGAAALYLKKGIRIDRQMDGGVQENSKRAGTENLPAIVGFGKACEIAKAEMPQNAARIKELRDLLIAELSKRIEHIYLNGSVENRISNNVNFSIEFVEGESLFLFLDSKGIMAASGSACASKDLKLSHVLTAIGVDTAIAQGSILFTLSKFNTKDDINYVLEEFPPLVKKLRDISPLYSYFLKTGKRKEAGPGTDYDDDHHHDSDSEG